MPSSPFAVRLALLAGLLASTCLAYAGSREQIVAEAKNGVLDLRQVDFTKQLVELRGFWAFYPFQLLSPASDFTAYPVRYVQTPALWKNIPTERGMLQAHGFATYRVKLLLPKGLPPDFLALNIPDAYTSFRVFVNDELIMELGHPDTTRELTRPGYRANARRLHLTADTVWITMQIANFHHRRGGPYRPLVLGDNDVIKMAKEHTRAFDLFLTGALIMGGLFFLGLYIWSRKDKVILYFALICIMYSYRIMGTGDYTVLYIYPGLNWFVALHLEYISLFLTVFFITLYSKALYPAEYNTVVARFFIFFSLACALGTIFTPSTVFTYLINPFLVAMLFNIAYTLYVYILGVKNRRPGALFSLISTFILGLLFLAIILAYFSVTQINGIILLVGYVLFFFLQSLVLSYRFANQLETARKEALYASKAKSNFLNTMSHEIRTPLNAVIGITTLMQQGEKVPENKDLIDTLQVSAKNLLFIINDILDVSKMEAGKANIYLAPVLLAPLADNVVRSVEVLAREKGLDIILDVSPKLQMQYVEADANRMTQVLLNLMQNAIKFTQKGHVKLSMQLEEQTAEACSVRISVADTGIGIPAEKQKIIFDQFTQVDSSINRGYGGTGLGLAICKEILALQGVKLELFSVMGEGSVFWFLQSFDKAAPPELDNLSGSDKQSEYTRLLSQKKVLIAEDNPINLMITQKLLLSAVPDLVVLHASNGREAVAMVQQSEPHVVLMDVHMPLMDGYEATQAIRALTDSKQSQTPIIGLTAGTPSEDKPHCINAGMNDMLPKPFTLDALLNTLVHHIATP